MEPGSVLWDVGANVGVYTLYAAARGLTVCSFEPEAANFHLLQRNLDLNDFHDRVTALNVAFGDRTGLTRFELASETIGAAKHKVRQDENDYGRCRHVLAFAARDLPRRLGLPRPNYIKIDVDGFELPVVRGLDLEDRDLREVLVEVRGNGDAPRVMETFAQKGFVTDGTLDWITAEDGRAVNFVFRRILAT